MGEDKPKVVAFGGGRGLSASLTALCELDVDLTAVVTVADNGGSSGTIRDSRPLLPPGDIRKALVATTADSSSAIAQLFAHRFDGNDFLTGHPVGNIALTSLFERHDDPVAAIAVAAQLLGCRAIVLPMSNTPLDITATVTDGAQIRTVHGQHEIAVAEGTVTELELIPAVAEPCPQVVEAIAEADWLIFGPGSWFTSVIPHLLLPGLRDAIEKSAARRILVLNLSQENETEGLDAPAHLDAMATYAKSVQFHYVISGLSRNLGRVSSLNKAALSLGAELVTADIAVDSTTHDTVALAHIVQEIFQRS